MSCHKTFIAALLISLVIEIAKGDSFVCDKKTFPINFPVTLDGIPEVILKIKSNSAIKPVFYISDLNTSIAIVELDFSSSEIRINCSRSLERENFLNTQEAFFKIRIINGILEVQRYADVEFKDIAKSICQKIEYINNVTLMVPRQLDFDLNVCSTKPSHEKNKETAEASNQIYIQVLLPVGVFFIIIGVICFLQKIRKQKNIIQVHKPNAETEVEVPSPTGQQRPPIPTPRTVFLERRQLLGNAGSSSSATYLSSQESLNFGPLRLETHPTEFTPEYTSLSHSNLPRLSLDLIHRHGNNEPISMSLLHVPQDTNFQSLRMLATGGFHHHSNHSPLLCPRSTSTSSPSQSPAQTLGVSSHIQASKPSTYLEVPSHHATTFISTSPTKSPSIDRSNEQDATYKCCSDDGSDDDHTYESITFV